MDFSKYVMSKWVDFPFREVNKEDLQKMMDELYQKLSSLSSYFDASMEDVLDEFSSFLLGYLEEKLKNMWSRDAERLFEAMFVVPYYSYFVGLQDAHLGVKEFAKGAAVMAELLHEAFEKFATHISAKFAREDSHA
ncbi:MAG: hypothetical protein QXW98_05740 [Candidatus Caldarchaeum sp.]